MTIGCTCNQANCELHIGLSKIVGSHSNPWDIPVRDDLLLKALNCTVIQQKIRENLKISTEDRGKWILLKNKVTKQLKALTLAKSSSNVQTRVTI